MLAQLPQELPGVTFTFCKAVLKMKQEGLQDPGEALPTPGRCLRFGCQHAPNASSAQMKRSADGALTAAPFGKVVNLTKHLLTLLLTFCAAQLFTLGAWGWRHRNLILADLENGRAVAAQLTFQRFSTVFQDVPTIQNLLSRRCTLADSLFVFQGTVSTDDFDVWVLLEPCGQRARTPVWQQVDWRPCFEIDDDRAIHVATPEREIIDTNDLRDGPHHWREQPCCTQHGGRTDHALHPGEQCGTRIATEHDRDMLNGCNRPPTPTNVRGQPNGKSLAKDLLTARQLLTHETANG
ncbi:hypothetical protein GCM10010840_34450 [Deinococcus aerolatus]|uniref:Uncharacterized protein n=1 Tax=Deinococcus aerolatus TaxID=522487 RepID=A0ABQ2GGL4_9DEIO|nr:hypothetical protein GCM10010840_34450 [Deinococcus aerolatus]